MIVQDRLGFPTVAIESQFTAPLKYGDIAVVQMNVISIGKSSLRMRYEFFRKEDGVKSFEAEITTVLMNLDTQNSVPLPDNYRTIFENYLVKS